MKAFRRVIIRAKIGRNVFVRRRSGQSASDYSLVKKNFPHKNQILTTPKLGPKKTVPVIAFTIALTIDVKNVWLGCQVAVCVNKRHTSELFGCSRIQKLNFDCLLHRLVICSTKTVNIFNFCVHCALSHLSGFQGLKYIPPFFGLKSQIMTLSQQYEKKMISFVWS